jgi:DNA-directed RNA polymerase subunit RPC12/RpoP
MEVSYVKRKDMTPEQLKEHLTEYNRNYYYTNRKLKRIYICDECGRKYITHAIKAEHIRNTCSSCIMKRISKLIIDRNNYVYREMGQATGSFKKYEILNKILDTLEKFENIMDS